MKFSELKLKKDGYNFSCNTYPSRSHYKSTMLFGRVFPTTKAQAKFFLAKKVVLDVLNFDDVEIVESLLNKHGMKGVYKYTTSKKWVRLENTDDLYSALKLEYSI